MSPKFVPAFTKQYWCDTSNVIIFERWRERKTFNNWAGKFDLEDKRYPFRQARFRDGFYTKRLFVDTIHVTGDHRHFSICILMCFHQLVEKNHLFLGSRHFFLFYLVCGNLVLKSDKFSTIFHYATSSLYS